MSLLRVQWDGRWREHGDWVVADYRAVCELRVELDAAAGDPAEVANVTPQLRFAEGPVPTNATQVSPLPPGCAGAWDVTLRPFMTMRFRARELAVYVQLVGRIVPPVTLSVIPARQARWCRRLIWLAAGLVLLVAWPLVELQPFERWQQAALVVFGVMPLGVVVDELRRLRSEQSLDGIYGRRPSLAFHAALAVPVLVVAFYLVRLTVVVFHNHTGHAIAISWQESRRDEFAPNARYTAISLDPIEDFAKRVRSASDAPSEYRYCLSPIAGCPGPLQGPVADESWFSVARDLSVTCRREPWSGLEQLDPTDLADVVRSAAGSFVAARVTDCAPLVATASVDVAQLFGSTLDNRHFSRARATIAYTGEFRNLQRSPPARGDRYLGLEVLQLRDVRGNPPLSLRWVGSVEDGYRGVVLEPRTPCLELAPDARTLPRCRTPPLPVPVQADSYRFDLEIGPDATQAWGTLTCFRRAAKQVAIWLLPLRDSSVRRAELRAPNGEALSRWSASESSERTGDRSPVLPLCLDANATPVHYGLDVVVPNLGGTADTPQFPLPLELARLTLRVFAEDTSETELLGTLTCVRDDDSLLGRLRLPSDADEATWSVHPSLPSAPAPGSRCNGRLESAADSTWVGSGVPLACHPLRGSIDATKECLPVRRRLAAGGVARCSYALADVPEKDECIRAVEHVCLLDQTGRPISTCPCSTVPAAGGLAPVLLDEARDFYGCMPSTAKLCPCST